MCKETISRIKLLVWILMPFAILNSISGMLVYSSIEAEVIYYTFFVSSLMIVIISILLLIYAHHYKKS